MHSAEIFQNISPTHTPEATKEGPEHTPGCSLLMALAFRQAEYPKHGSGPRHTHGAWTWAEDRTPCSTLRSTHLKAETKPEKCLFHPTPHHSYGLPRATSDTVRTSLSGLHVYREMAKFRRFLIPHTPIIILFSAVWSDEGGMLVLSSSAIFILASCFGRKICQNWKPPCVQWHLICPKQRRGELVHLSRLLLHVLSSQRLESTALCSLVLAENPAQKIYLLTSRFTGALSQTRAAFHIWKRTTSWRRDPFRKQSCLFFCFNTEGIIPHFLGARRMSPVSFLKGTFPMVAMLVLTISSALLVLLPSLTIHFSSPAPNLCLLC